MSRSAPLRLLLAAIAGALVSACAGGLTSIPPERAERDALVEEVGRECAQEFPTVRVTGVDQYGRLLADYRSPADWRGFRGCFQQRMRQRLAGRFAVGTGRLVPATGGPDRTSVAVDVGPGVLVPVTVNRSQRATLLLDTGATLTVLTPPVLARAGITVPMNAPKVIVQVMGGGTVSMPYVRIGSLTVGEFTVQDIDVGVYDVAGHRPGPEGLLGENFLSHFRVTVDRRARRLTLERSPTRPPAAADASRFWPVPAWAPGDEWSIRWESPRGKGTSVRRMEGEELIEGVAHYVVRSGRRTHYYIKESLGWHFEKLDSDVVVRWSPPVAWEWPLHVGKRWERRYQRENPRAQKTEDGYLACEVAAEETITVPAGTFQTLLVICRNRADRVVRETWYAPAAKHWVKEKMVGSEGDGWRELVSYRIR